jgi:hypothetical protein
VSGGTVWKVVLDFFRITDIQAIALIDMSTSAMPTLRQRNQIVVFVHARVRARGSDEWQDVRLADVYTFHDRKAIQMRAFADRREALRLVGVDDSGAIP